MAGRIVRLGCWFLGIGEVVIRLMGMGLWNFVYGFLLVRYGDLVFSFDQRWCCMVGICWEFLGSFFLSSFCLVPYDGNGRYPGNGVIYEV